MNLSEEVDLEACKLDNLTYDWIDVNRPDKISNADISAIC
jgi:hypothetical protein